MFCKGGGKFSNCGVRLHCGRALWPALWLLLCLPGIAASAKPPDSQGDEAAIRAFQRRVSEIKRLMGPDTTSEPPVETAAPPRGKNRVAPAEKQRLTKPRPLQARAGDREGRENPGWSPPAGNRPAPPAEPDPELDRLRQQLILSEARLQSLEAGVAAGRRWIVLNLALFGGLAVGLPLWLFHLHRNFRKAEQKHPMEKAPEEPEMLFREGIAAYREHRLEQALTLFNRVLAAEPTHISAHLHRGNVFFRLREFQKAHRDYRRMFELDPGNRSAYLSVAELYVTAGQFGIALEVLEQGRGCCRGPEATAMFAFLEFAARTLSGQETTEVETRFNKAMEKNFVLTWSLREVALWLQTTEFSAAAKGKIALLLRQLQSRGGRLANPAEVEVEELQGNLHLHPPAVVHADADRLAFLRHQEEGTSLTVGNLQP